MKRFEVGDRVKIDIPDERDPDHRLHGEHGKITNIVDDDAGESTGDERDSAIYTVELNPGRTVDFRWWDLRPPID